MSLIHEALKRVETHKAPSDAPGPGGPPQPGQTGAGSTLRAAPTVPHPLPLDPTGPSSAARRLLFARSPIAMALGMAIAIGASLMAVTVVQRDLTPPPTAPVATRARPAAGAQTPAEAFVQVAAQAPAVAPIEAPVQVNPGSPPAQQAAAPEASTPPTSAPAADPSPLSPLAEAELSLPAPELEPAPVCPALRPSDVAAKFKVSGIMSGPTGGAALINGRMVNVGQEIDGARLVATTANTIQLEIEGERFSLGIQP